MSNKHEIVLHLDEILNQKSITKYKLAKDTGISLKTLYSIKKRDLHLSTAIEICVYLDITICQLISIKKLNN